MEAIIFTVDQMIARVLNSESNEQTASILSSFMDEWHNVKYDYLKENGQIPKPSRKSRLYSFQERIVEKVKERLEDDLISEMVEKFDEEKLVDTIISDVDVKHEAECMMDDMYEALSRKIQSDSDGYGFSFDDIEDEVTEQILNS